MEDVKADLLRACQEEETESTLDTVRSILERHPEAINTATLSTDQNPCSSILEVAISSGKSLPLIQFLVNLWPDNTTIKTNTNLYKQQQRLLRAGTFLRAACLANRPQPSVIRCLLKKWPQSASGCAALHYLVDRMDMERSEETIDWNDLLLSFQYIIKSAPESIGKGFYTSTDRDSAFHRLATSYWYNARGMLISLITLYPEICRLQGTGLNTILHDFLEYGLDTELENFMRRNDDWKARQLVLNRACDLVNAIVEAYPECVRMVNCREHLPIHDLARHAGKRMDLSPLVQILVDAWPESLKELPGRKLIAGGPTIPLQEALSYYSTGLPDRKQLIPFCPNQHMTTTGEILHYMMETKRIFGSQIDDWFTQNKTPQDEGDNVLHALCRLRVTKAFRDKILQEQMPEWRARVRALLRTRNAAGQLPIHLACLAPTIDQDTLISLANVYPELVSIPDPRGDGPLHLILRHHPRAHLAIQHFAKKGVTAVGRRDSEGVLPFFRAAEGSSVQALFPLTLHNPEVFLASIRWESIPDTKIVASAPSLNHERKRPA